MKKKKKNLFFYKKYRLDYRSVINCKNINDFFQINRSFIHNANNLLEKLSGVLKKTISRETLSNEDKKLISDLKEEKKKMKENFTQAEFSKCISEKNEEIKKLKDILQGSFV